MVALSYVLVLVVFVGIDAVWLTSMVDRAYRPLIGEILTDQPRLAPAVVFYLIYAAGLAFFATAPAVREGSWRTALVNGALLGLFAYGTYDLTNYATVRAWGLRITLVDLTWGVVLSGVSAAIAAALAMRLGRSFGLSA